MKGVSVRLYGIWNMEYSLMPTEKTNQDQNLVLEEIIETIKANEFELLRQHQLNRIGAKAEAEIEAQSIEPRKCQYSLEIS